MRREAAIYIGNKLRSFAVEMDAVERSLATLAADVAHDEEPDEGSLADVATFVSIHDHVRDARATIELTLGGFAEAERAALAGHPLGIAGLIPAVKRRIQREKLD